MKKSILLIALAASLSILTGCGTTSKFVYPSNMRNLKQVEESKFTTKTVAVLPFDDMRSDENNASTLYLALIPLFPYGWSMYERPEAAQNFLTIEKFDFNASEDLAKAAALSLRRSRMFKDAWFTFGGDKYRADYVFKGEIISTRYNALMYSYGASLACSYIWLLGAPAGTSENSLAIKFSLQDKNDKILWTYSFDNKEKILQGLYYRSGDDIRMYARLMEQAMNKSISDMHKKLNK
jgi:hypothetical protein